MDDEERFYFFGIIYLFNAPQRADQQNLRKKSTIYRMCTILKFKIISTIKEISDMI